MIAPTLGSFYYLLDAPDGAVYLYNRSSDLARHLTGSGDGGQTWADLGPVGGPWPFGISQVAVGPDGRLYAGGRDSGVQNGNPAGGVFRTVLPVVVAAEPSASPPVPAALVVAVFPNPATGAVTARLSGLAPGQAVRVALYDVAGRLVAVLHDGPASARAAFSVDTASLAPGTYLVRVAAREASATAAFTVAQ